MPDPATAPRRDAVLAGNLDEFDADATTLSTWFGVGRAAALAADPDGPRAALDRDIAAIDAMLGVQLDAILHHPRLQRLEGSWRGLSWLLDRIGPGKRGIKLRVLNLSWPELCRDLERAPEFDQSQLFRRIYEDEFGTPGGEPFGLLIVDHEVRHRPGAGAPSDDVGTLKLLSSIAAAAFVPTVLAASPALLGVDSFVELSPAADPAAPFRSGEYARWRGLCGRDDMRFLAVVLPRVLARPPWTDCPARADRFRYQEYAPDASCRVWMTAGYAFAATVTRAFANHAWPADVRGVEPDRRGGGLVDALPLEPFATDPDRVAVRPSLDLLLTDRQERALVDAGFMPLSALPYSEEAVFGSVRSLQLPAAFAGPNAPAANANARLSAQMNSMLCAARFAHCLKLMGRRMVGAFRTADEIERELQTWLDRYVDSNVAGDRDARSRFPLVEGKVSISERPDKPGVFGCVMHLQPHYQLDNVAATLLVTDIAVSGTG